MLDSSRRFRRTLVNTVTFILVVVASSYLVWALRPLILPVVLGILLAYLFRPFKTAFKYRWLPNSLRVILLFSVLTGSLLCGIAFVKNSIPNDKEKLEILVRLKYKFNEKFNKMMEIDPTTGKGNRLYELISSDVNPLRISFNNYLELSDTQKDEFLRYKNGVVGFDPIPDKYYEYFLANNKLSKIAFDENLNQNRRDAANQPAQASQDSFLKTLINIMSIWFLLPIVFIFFLLDDGAIFQFFVRMIPNRYFELALSIKEEVDTAIGNYLRGMCIECALVAVSLALGLFVIGLPFKMSLLIGLLSGLATAIPLLGPIVGIAFGLVYALITEEIHPLMPGMTLDNLILAVIVVNILVMALDNLVFQPFVLGSSVDLHPLVVIIGLMAGSMIFGVAGVLLAIPAIVVLKVVVHQTFRGLKDYRII